jgi:hypothetical protein
MARFRVGVGRRRQFASGFFFRASLSVGSGVPAGGSKGGAVMAVD